MLRWGLFEKCFFSGCRLNIHFPEQDQSNPLHHLRKHNGYVVRLKKPNRAIHDDYDSALYMSLMQKSALIHWFWNFNNKDSNIPEILIKHFFNFSLVHINKYQISRYFMIFSFKLHLNAFNACYPCYYYELLLLLLSKSFTHLIGYMQVYKYAMQVCNYEIMKVCKYVSMQ